VLGNLFLGTFVLLKDHRNRINLSYASTALITALWAIAILLFDKSTLSSEALFWCRSSYVLLAILPIPFLYFFTVFPLEDDAPKRYQLIAWVCVTAFFVLLSFTEIIVKNVAILDGRPSFVPGDAFLLFVFYFIGFIVFAFQRLTEKFNAYEGLNRRQITYVFWGFFLGFSFPVVTNLFLPLIGYTLLASYGPFATIITVGFISYSITKSRLMDISVVVSRTVAEVLTIITHGTLYLAIIMAYRAYVSKEIDFPIITLTLFYGGFIGLTQHSVRIFFQTSADKFFLQGKYNYYKALSEASSHVVEKLSFPDILNVLYKTFSDVVEISNPRVYLPEYFSDIEKVSKRYLAYDKTTHLPIENCEPINFDDPIINELVANRESIHETKKLKASMVVPCLLENRLIAIFVLGPKLSEDAYTEDDERLLQTLANQAAVALDHTRTYEKIAADLEEKERQLERSQRLASIGTLTAGVTHEIRNPLTAIRAETERLTTQPRDAEFLKNFQDLAIRNIARIEKIVDRMLGLARQKDKQHISINLNEQLEAILPFIPTHNITITKELNNLPAIQGDPEQLQEVFINIIQNAVQVMPNGGAINIKTMGEKDNVIIEISDNGPGIAPEIQEKIFDPFFSTRHEGTGLGLSIAYRIIREHGGDIKVISAVGKGTTFRITF